MNLFLNEGKNRHFNIYYYVNENDVFHFYSLLLAENQHNASPKTSSKNTLER